MNREQATDRFVGENLAALSDPRATRLVVKRLRQGFQERTQAPAGERFTGYDVAEDLAKRIARNKRSSPEEEVVSLLTSLPHVREELGEPEIRAIVAEARIGEGTRLTSSDLSQLGSEKFIGELDREFRHRANAEAEEHLLEERRRLLDTITQLRERKEVLDEAYSKLDSVPADVDLETLIDQEAASSVAEDLTVWWKELGLTSDPFSSNRGLSDIPKSKYDDVVVRTPFVQSYVDRIERQPDSFFGKTIVVLGEFGSGKTTLFQLVGAKAATRGLLPILMSLHPDVSVSRLTNQLIGQLHEALVQTYPHLADHGISGPTEVPDEIGRAIQSLSEAARRASTTRGFLLFVDGLHKTEAYLKQSIEFLSQLQTLQERFELRGLKVGILVAGSGRWETELTANPALSGSFYKLDTIPALAEDQAVEAVIRRIRSFSSPTGTPPTIIREPLRSAYRILADRLLRSPTFRDYLDHVRDRFIARDYLTVGVSIRLHAETVKAARALIDSDPLAQTYRNLTNPSLYGPLVREGIRKVLPELCARKGIPVTDPIVDRFEGSFVALRRQGWVVSLLDKGSRRPTLHLTEPVVRFLRKAQEPPSRIMAIQALEAIFTELKDVTPGETKSIYGPIIQQMETMAATWRAGLPDTADLVERCIHQVKEIDRKCNSISVSGQIDVSDEARNSILLLVRGILLILKQSGVKDSAPGDIFRSVWCAPENVDAILRPTVASTVFDSAKPESWGLLHGHAQALSDLCELLSALVRGEDTCRLAGRKLALQELTRLHEARMAFLAHRYEETAGIVSELAEAKIRESLFTALRCVAGERALTLLPADIRTKVKEQHRGHPRAQRAPDYNFLLEVSRSELPKILLSSEVVRSVLGDLVKDIELPRFRSDIELLFSLGDRVAHHDRPSYFREKSTEIRDALACCPRLCSLMNELISRLIVGPTFSMRKVNGDVEFAFGLSRDGTASHRVSLAEVDSAVVALLDRLESGELFIPPVESALAQLQATPEIGIAAIRGCASQDLVDVEVLTNWFGYEVGLTGKGEARLAAVRKSRTTTVGPGQTGSLA
jgi:hypothetical protein